MTSIEWVKSADGSAGATWNPIRARNLETGQVGTHCVKISPGCTHCYAETHNGRNLPAGSSGLPYTQAGAARVEYFIDPKILAAPLRRKKAQTYFVCSMTDLFLSPPEMIAAVYGVMEVCPQHTFQCLTKRPEKARAFSDWHDRDAYAYTAYTHNHLLGPFDEPETPWRRAYERFHNADDGYDGPLRNVWQGVSVENRTHGLPRIDILRQIPAALRFLSIEPLLEDLGELDLTGISWCIIGGESGNGARPFDLEWARDIISQCRAAGIPAFFKQAGANAHARGWDRPEGYGSVPIRFEDRKGGDPAEWPEDLRVREMPERSNRAASNVMG